MKKIFCVTEDDVIIHYASSYKKAVDYVLEYTKLENLEYDYYNMRTGFSQFGKTITHLGFIGEYIYEVVEVVLDECYPALFSVFDKFGESNALYLYIDARTCMRVTDSKPLPKFGEVLKDMYIDGNLTEVGDFLLDGTVKSIIKHYATPQCDRNAFTKDQREFVEKLKSLCE